MRNRNKLGCLLLLAFLSLPLCLPGSAVAAEKGAKDDKSTRKDQKAHEVTVPVLLLEGGRKLVFEGTFSMEREVKPKRGFWKKVLDVVAGEPQFRVLVRPFSVVTDSRGRVIVTDPGAGGVHIFDFKEQKYKFITRKDKTNDAMQSPQCVTVDDKDNIYVTDSESGKIFVFEPGGKLNRVIGSLKYGEGRFKRPTGIAVDSAVQRIYVTDTLRNQIFMMDMQGNVLQKIGKNGSGDGEFNFPTELRLDGQNLIVVDAMNFRVQVLDRSGAFQYAIGKLGEGQGEMFRPKAVGIDSEGHLYVVEGLSGIVQVFDRQGQLLYYFGKRGSGFGDFQLPTGLFIDRADRVYVVDSYNQRVQVFRYFAVAKQAAGGAQ
jgi:DNA-binding beta-propeller fold protein YncE